MLRLAQITGPQESGRTWTLIAVGLLLGLASAFFISSPLIGSMLVATIVGVAVGVKRPQWTLFLFAATLMLGEMSIGPATSVSSATALLFLVVTAIYVFLANPPLHTRSAIPVLLAGWAICLVMNAAMKPEWTLEHPRGVITFWLLALTAMAVILILRNGEWIWQLATVFSLSSAFVSLVTIYEAVTGQFNQLSVFEGASDDRAYGLSDPNYTSALLVTFMPFVLIHVLAGRSKTWRIVAMGVIGMNLAAIASTASRGGVVGVLVLGVSMSIWANAPNWDKSRENTALRRRAAIIVLLLLCGIIAVATAPQVFRDRMSTLEDWSDPAGMKDSRVGLWSDYIEVWLKSPVWGHGPGWLDPVLIGNSTQFPHNTILQLAIEVGLVGLIPYFVLSGWAFWGALRARRLFAQQGNERFSVLSGGVALSLIGFHTTAFFLSSAGHKELWVLIGMAAALHHIATSPEHSLSTAWR